MFSAEPQQGEPGLNSEFQGAVKQPVQGQASQGGHFHLQEKKNHKAQCGNTESQEFELSKCSLQDYWNCVL